MLVGKMTISTSSIKMAFMVVVLTTTTVFSHETKSTKEPVSTDKSQLSKPVEEPIPADKSQLPTWFNNNVKPYYERRSILDPCLVAAEASVMIIKVMKNGKGNFKTITDAIKSIPNGNTKRVIIYIGSGTYNEKINIERTKPFVTLYGAPGSIPNLIYGGNDDGATLVVESDYFVATNVNISNNGKKLGAQPMALKISGDKAAFYGVTMNGFHDTLYDDKGRHFFKDCIIKGAVNFIFGMGKSMYLNTKLSLVGEFAIRATASQATNNEKEDISYSFIHCDITGTGTGTLLGKQWMSIPKVVYAYTILPKVMLPLGWRLLHPHPFAKAVFFGQLMHKVAGAHIRRHAELIKQLSDSQARAFISLGYIEASKWLLPPPTPKV